MSAKNYEFVEHITCDIVIYGGSMGACAAVIASQNLEADLDVVLVHQADWIGGQMPTATSNLRFNCYRRMRSANKAPLSVQQK